MFRVFESSRVWLGLAMPVVFTFALSQESRHVGLCSASQVRAVFAMSGYVLASGGSRVEASVVASWAVGGVVSQSWSAGNCWVGHNGHRSVVVWRGSRDKASSGE
jgi:hypothetical protein